MSGGSGSPSFFFGLSLSLSPLSPFLPALPSPRPKNCKVDLALPLDEAISLRHNRRNPQEITERERERERDRRTERAREGVGKRDPQSLHKITTDRVCTIWILSLSLSASPCLSTAALNFCNKERFRNNWQPSGSDAAAAAKIRPMPSTVEGYGAVAEAANGLLV